MCFFNQGGACDDHNRFSVMLIPRNLNLLHLSPTDVDKSVYLCLRLPEISNHLLSFSDTEQQIVLCAPLCKIVDFLPM